MNLCGATITLQVNNNKELVDKIKPVIMEWLKINRDYIEYTSGSDCLYWFNERATVSSLAGAVWRLGGYAQEEYSSTKGLNKRNGRVDLYFTYNDTSVVCEAKQLELYLNPKARKVYLDEISTSLNSAIKDIKETKAAAEYQDQSLAITFVICRKVKGRDVKILEDEYLEALFDLECDFFALFRSSGFEINDGASNIYNDVCLIGTFV